MLYLKTSAMQRPRSIILGVVMFLLTFNEHLQAQRPKELTNSIGMKLKLIPKGTFDMGSAANDQMTGGSMICTATLGSGSLIGMKFIRARTLLTPKDLARERTASTAEPVGITAQAITVRPIVPPLHRRFAALSFSVSASGLPSIPQTRS